MNILACPHRHPALVRRYTGSSCRNFQHLDITGTLPLITEGCCFDTPRRWQEAIAEWSRALVGVKRKVAGSLTLSEANTDEIHSE